MKPTLNEAPSSLKRFFKVSIFFSRTIFVIGFLWLSAAAAITQPLIKAAWIGATSDYYGKETLTKEEFLTVSNQIYTKVSHSIPSALIPLFLLLIAWTSEIKLQNLKNKKA